MSTGLVAAEYVVADYDYKTASTSNATSTAQTHGATGVRYAFPGRYPSASDGTRAAALQLAAQQMDQQTGQAASACFALTAGSQVSLAGHANAGFNVSYVVRKVEHRATNDQYDNDFDVFPAQVAFRAPRVSARPVVAGTHTAVVTGSSGEEIWTDSLGRIKGEIPLGPHERRRRKQFVLGARRAGVGGRGMGSSVPAARRSGSGPGAIHGTGAVSGFNKQIS